jgi:DNA repair photolyase
VPRVAKSELPNRLAFELSTVDPGAHISVGSVCDAYPGCESGYGVTRTALELLIANERTFSIITKGTTVLRDLDLLGEYPHASVRVSLCTTDEQALKRIDPWAPSASERLRVVEAIATAGVDVGISAAPWIPGISDAAALVAAAPTGVPIRFAPLNVRSPKIAATPYGRRYSQEAVNDAYVREHERVGSPPGVSWLRPIPLGDSTTHPFARLGA